MSVINWDACLVPILSNQAWTLTGAACGPDSVFQEMMGTHRDNPHQQRLQDDVDDTPMEKVTGTSYFSSMEYLQPCNSCEWKHAVLPHSLPFPPSALTFLSTYCDLLALPAMTSQEWQELACLWKAGVKLGATFLNIRCRKERPSTAWLSCYKCSARACPWTWIFSRFHTLTLWV